MVDALHPNPLERGEAGRVESTSQSKILRGRKVTKGTVGKTISEQLRSVALAPMKNQFLVCLEESRKVDFPKRIDTLHTRLGGELLDVCTESGIHIKAMHFKADHHQTNAAEDIFCRAESQVENPSPTGPTVIFLSGSDTSVFAQEYQPIIASYLARGINVAIVDYPGVGQSEGSFSVENSYEAAESLYEHLLKTGVPADKILIEGYSMGSGPATHLAADHPETTLLLRCPFVRMSEIGGQVLISDSHVPSVIAKLLTSTAQFALPYDNEKMIRKVKGRVGLITAGDDDMYNKKLKTVERLQGAYHGDKGFTHYPKEAGDSSNHESTYSGQPLLASRLDQFLIESGFTKPIIR